MIQEEVYKHIKIETVERNIKNKTYTVYLLKFKESIIGKSCSKCLEILPLSNFNNSINGIASKHAYCKTCHRNYTKQKEKEAKAKKLFEKLLKEKNIDKLNKLIQCLES
ncbi:hypothetical protein [Tepidibacter formicigenes]|jgi:hypothetical protein|uniref:Uncharacterized protein n=1 Tax=Tepidibacter formicigenes DSM 15518 TaxID=1123349 RepID=A0A1M6T0I7_9FIRM|nr:hypothetical protein [Tepidibacter formicigenes]SHK50512.1 hypothetical protein SAMN02744037_02480 [Tepidibacter formicigenes DSM 15518]